MHFSPASLRLLLVFLVVLSPSVSVYASEFAPVEIMLDDAPNAAEAGQIFSGTLIIHAAKTCQLDNVTLSGSGWSVQATSLKKSYDLQAREMVRIAFEAIPNDPNQSLIFHFSNAGESVQRAFDLSSTHILELTNPAVNYWAPGVRLEVETATVLAEAPAAIVTTGDPENRSTTISATVAYVYAPNGVVVPMEYSNVAIVHPILGSILYTTTTNSVGFFTFTTDFIDPMGTDYEVWAYASNNRVLVQNSDFFESNWKFRLGTVEFNGQTHNLGSLAPANSNANTAFHIANNIRRGGNYLDSYVGYDMDLVEVIWPGGYGTYYNPVFEEIHIGDDRRWNERAYLHEYGHYWGYHHVYTPDFDYDNGICDDQPFWEGLITGGSHCLWCEESTAVAWNEAIAHFISRICTDHIKNSYATLPGDCTEVGIQSVNTEFCPNQHRPDWTEGFVAALFYDFWDRYDTGENDPVQPEFEDVVTGWQDPLFMVLTSHCSSYTDRPHSAEMFLNCFADHYPSLTEDIWEVGKNCDFDYDTEPPGIATGLTSVPMVGTPSPDNTITVSWTRAPDDWSGIKGYGASVTTTPTMPPQLMQMEDVTSTTTLEVPPGTYYYNLRAIDRAGHWSDTYTSIGPIIVEEAEPADLFPYAGTGWEWPLVPRNSSDALYNDCTVTGNLPGGGNTWWNLSYINIGDVSTGSATTAGIYVDGVKDSDSYVGVLGAGVGSQQRNRGPITVSGGRHTFRTRLDDGEILAEPSESNNYWAGQWVWSPPEIENRYYPTTKVPCNLADAEYFHWQDPYYLNCAGFEMPMHLLAYGTTMYASAHYKDFDLKLYSSFNTATLGFDLALATSSRPEGLLDAIIVNPVVAGYADYNVGVYSADEGSHNGFWLSRQAADLLGSDYGTSNLCLDQVGPMNLFYFMPPGSSDGAVTFELTVDLDSPPLHMGYFDADFGVGSLLDATEMVTASVGHPAQIELVQATNAYGIIAVWREPGVGGMSMCANAALEYKATLPDLRPNFATDWHGPVVPQQDNSIAYPYPANPAPEYLPGDAASTYLYFSYINDSTVSSFVPGLGFLLDGESLVSTNQGTALPAHSQRSGRMASPLNIPGGRHTLGVIVDHNDQLPESNEVNNGYAYQWVWSPSTTYFLGTAQAMNDIPYVFGGWDQLHETSPKFANVKGFRTDNLAQINDHFAGVFVCPNDTSVIDVKLYDTAVSATEGFGHFLHYSNQAEGEADFILFDVENLNDAERIDFGVSHWSGLNSGVYQLEIGQWLPGANGVIGSHGPFLLDSDDMLDIYTLILPEPGSYRFTLVPDSPTDVDIGFSMHRGTFSSRQDGMLVGGSFEGADQYEEFTVELAGSETFCSLAVWRRRQEGMTTPVSYSIIISPELSPVEDQPPVLPQVTKLGQPTPNPFNPQTTISFDLQKEENVKIQIHDLRGRPVRSLVSERMPAGNHAVLWDGRDNAGRMQASGIYFVRMETGSVTEMKKLTLIK